MNLLILGHTRYLKNGIVLFKEYIGYYFSMQIGGFFFYILYLFYCYISYHYYKINLH